jgi:hypothetical protein
MIKNIEIIMKPLLMTYIDMFIEYAKLIDTNSNYCRRIIRYKIRSF